MPLQRLCIFIVTICNAPEVINAEVRAVVRGRTKPSADDSSCPKYEGDFKAWREQRDAFAQSTLKELEEPTSGSVAMKAFTKYKDGFRKVSEDILSATPTISSSPGFCSTPGSGTGFGYDVERFGALSFPKAAQQLHAARQPQEPDQPLRPISLRLYRDADQEGISAVWPTAMFWPSLFPNADGSSPRDWQRSAHDHADEDPAEEDDQVAIQQSLISSNEERTMQQNFMKEIFALQNPEDCKTARFVYLPSDLNQTTTSITDWLDLAIPYFAYAHATGRTLMIQTTHSYLPWEMAPECQDKASYLCYLEPVTPCTEDDIEEEIMVPLAKATGDERIITDVKAPLKYSAGCVLCRNALVQSLCEHFDPLACRTCPNSKLWIESQYMAFLVQPRADLLAAFHIQKVHMHWHSNITAVAGFHLNDLSAPAYLQAQQWIKQANAEIDNPVVAFGTTGEAETSSEARLGTHQAGSELIRLGMLLGESGTAILRPPKTSHEMMDAYEFSQEQRRIFAEVGSWIRKKAEFWSTQQPEEEKSEEDFDDESKIHRALRLTIQRELYEAENGHDVGADLVMSENRDNAHRLLKTATSEHKIAEERAKESLANVEMTQFVLDAKMALLHETTRKAKNADPPPEMDPLDGVSEEQREAERKGLIKHLEKKVQERIDEFKKVEEEAKSLSREEALELLRRGKQKLQDAQQSLYKARHALPLGMTENLVLGYDENGDGEIDVTELGKALVRLGVAERYSPHLDTAVEVVLSNIGGGHGEKKVHVFNLIKWLGGEHVIKRAAKSFWAHTKTGGSTGRSNWAVHLETILKEVANEEREEELSAGKQVKQDKEELERLTKELHEAEQRVEFIETSKTQRDLDVEKRLHLLELKERGSANWQEDLINLCQHGDTQDDSKTPGLEHFGAGDTSPDFRAAVTVFRDLWHLAHAESFVGDGSSSFSRVALRLMLAEDWSRATKWKFVKSDQEGLWPFGYTQRGY